MTVRYRSLTFRSVDALLQVPCGVPYRLFTMLCDPTMASDLSKLLNTPCGLDDWSKGFLNFSQWRAGQR